MEPELKVSACSVALDAHPAGNVLSRELYRAWQFKGTDRGWITVKLVPPSSIFRVQITNAGSQFVEMMGSKTEQGDDWEPIIHKAVLRTQAEIKEGKSRDRPRTFTTDSESVTQLSKSAKESTWCRLKITCSCAEDSLRLFDHLSSDGRHAQGLMGLAQLRVFSSLELPEEAAPVAQPAPAPVTHRKESTANTNAKPHPAVSNPSARPAHVAPKTSKPAQANKYPIPTPAKTPSSNKSAESSSDAPVSKPVTPPTSHRLQPSTKFAHWTKAKEFRAPGSSSSFRGASASQHIRKSLSAPDVRSDDQVKQDLSKRLAQFVKTIAPASLEETTTKQAKSAVMHYFDDFGAVWQKHKPFFKQTLEDLLNDQLEKHEKSQRASTAASVRTQSKEKKESGCSSAASSAPSAPAPAAAKPPQPTDSARAPDPVQGVIARHIADFLDSLPAHVAPESVTLRQLKKALQVHFTNWECIWESHREFFKDEAVRQLQRTLSERTARGGARKVGTGGKQQQDSVAKTAHTEAVVNLADVTCHIKDECVSREDTKRQCAAGSEADGGNSAKRARVATAVPSQDVIVLD